MDSLGSWYLHCILADKKSQLAKGSRLSGYLGNTSRPPLPLTNDSHIFVYVGGGVRLLFQRGFQG